VSDRLIAVKLAPAMPFSFMCRLEAIRGLGWSTAQSIRARVRGY
jgi:hypothetical protein